MTTIDYGELYRGIYHDPDDWQGKNACIDKMDEKMKEIVWEHPCLKGRTTEGLTGKVEKISEEDYWRYWTHSPEFVIYVEIPRTEEYRQGRPGTRYNSFTTHAFCWKDVCTVNDHDSYPNPHDYHYYKIECPAFTGLDIPNTMITLNNYLAQIDECKSAIEQSKQEVEAYSGHIPRGMNKRSYINQLDRQRDKVWRFEDKIKGALNNLESGEDAFNDWYKEEERDNSADIMQSESVESSNRSHDVRDALQIISKAISGEVPAPIDIDNECKVNL